MIDRVDRPARPNAIGHALIRLSQNKDVLMLLEVGCQINDANRQQTSINKTVLTALPENIETYSNETVGGRVIYSKTGENMKKLFSLAILLIVLFGSCDKSVEPSGPLYRTWRLVQTQVGKRAPQLIASSERITIAFQPNGRIVYDRNGQDGSCCVPRRFDRKGRVLFVDSSTDQPEFCKYVDLACTADEYVSGSVEWTVIDVDSGQLVLQIGDKLLTHQPYA